MVRWVFGHRGLRRGDLRGCEALTAQCGLAGRLKAQRGRVQPIQSAPALLGQGADVVEHLALPAGRIAEDVQPPSLGQGQQS